MSTIAQANFIREAMEAGVMSDNGIMAKTLALGDRATDELLACLDDEEVGIRAIALILLGRIGDRRAVPAILEFIDDDRRDARNRIRNGALRLRVLWLLSKWYREINRSNMENEPAIDLSRAAWALGKLGDPSAKPTLARLTEHPNELVRQSASSALEELA